MRWYRIKELYSFFLALALFFSLAACGPAKKQDVAAPAHTPEASLPSQPDSSLPAECEASPETAGGEAKILITYFSVTDNTEGIANHLNDTLDADLHEIIPKQPDTSDDLNCNDSSSRSSLEMNDPAQDCRKNRQLRRPCAGTAERCLGYHLFTAGFYRDLKMDEACC